MLKSYIQKELEILLGDLKARDRLKANFVIKEGNKHTIVEVDFKKEPPEVVFHLSGIKQSFKDNLKEIISIGLKKIHD